MPFSFGGVSTLAFDGSLQWTSGTSYNNLDPESVVGRKLWDWSPNPDPIRRALAAALFDGTPQTFTAGWMPEGTGKLLHTKATVFPLPRGRMHDAVLLWADAHEGHQLSPRELRTLREYASGLLEREVAKKLRVTLPTVKSALHRVRHKLGARHIGHAIALAKERGLI